MFKANSAIKIFTYSFLFSSHIKNCVHVQTVLGPSYEVKALGFLRVLTSSNCITTLYNVFSTMEESHEYRGVLWGILSTMRDIVMNVGDTLSTVGAFRTVRGCNLLLFE